MNKFTGKTYIPYIIANDSSSSAIVRQVSWLSQLFSLPIHGLKYGCLHQLFRQQ